MPRPSHTAKPCVFEQKITTDIDDARERDAPRVLAVIVVEPKPDSGPQHGVAPVRSRDDVARLDGRDKLSRSISVIKIMDDVPSREQNERQSSK